MFFRSLRLFPLLVVILVFIVRISMIFRFTCQFICLKLSSFTFSLPFPYLLILNSIQFKLNYRRAHVAPNTPPFRYFSCSYILFMIGVSLSNIIDIMVPAYFFLSSSFITCYLLFSASNLSSPSGLRFLLSIIRLRLFFKGFKKQSCIFCIFSFLQFP